jgi:hypothetical protein
VVTLLSAAMLLACGDAPESTGRPALSGAPGEKTGAEPARHRIVGVKIYETERKIPDLFDQWEGLGINTVFVGENLTMSGGFRALARKRGVDHFVIFPVFFAPEVLAEEPDLWAITAEGERAREDWVGFACPSRPVFRDRRIREAKSIVERLRPDGLSLDFIRHFVFWEMVGPERDPSSLPETCYCVHCLQAFAVSLGIPAAAIPPHPQRAAAWIEANAAEHWVRFKTETITSMAVEIADAVRKLDPEIQIAVHMVPWRRDDYDDGAVRVAGQDASALGEVADYLSPMAYSFMLHRPPEWISSVVQDLDWMAGCRVLPSIQVAPAYREGEVFSSGEFEAALHAALEPPSAGVVFWSWDHIEADPERAEIIRRVLRGTKGDVGG